MTKIDRINRQFADLSCEVSVAPDGIGFDIHDTSTGDWVGSVDDLSEAKLFLQSIADEFENELMN